MTTPANRRSAARRPRPVAALLLCAALAAATRAQTPPDTRDQPADKEWTPKSGVDVHARLILRQTQARRQTDAVIWVHPDQPAYSTVIVADPAADRLFVYDATGKCLQRVPAINATEVDLRYDVNLGDNRRGDVVVALRRSKFGRLLIYAVDAKTRTLTRLDNNRVYVGDMQAMCLYKSLTSDKLYAVVAETTGAIRYYELIPDEDGGLTKSRERGAHHQVLGACEGLLADDENAALYVAEKDRCIYRYGAEPDDPAKGKPLVLARNDDLGDTMTDMAMYTRADGAGYLLVAGTDAGRICVYDRRDPKRYLGSFVVRGCDSPATIAAVSVPMLAPFDRGLVVCHDNRRSRHTGPRLVPWRKLAGHLQLPDEPKAATPWRPRNAARLQPSPTPADKTPPRRR